MLTLTFPTNAELNTVVEEYSVQPDNYIGKDILPETESFAQKVRWDERDRDRGMTAPHTMDGDPKIDKRMGSKTHEYTPIPFKETDVLKESEILQARELGTLNGTLNLSREIARIAKNRHDKTKARIEWLRWQTLRGQITINENGVKVSETFPVQSYNVVNDWDDLEDATPLKDFNAIKLMFRGTGASPKNAQVYMNQTTANWLLENQNPNDLKGFQNSNFVNLAFSVDELNKILTGRGLPNIIVYDEFYVDESNDEQLFIPDAEIIVVGARPGGQKVGDVLNTPSLHRTQNGMPAPGYFNILEVNGKASEQVGSVTISELGSSKNPKIENTGGQYGGTRLIFPRSVIKSQVAS